jgi:nucleoside-diphosphate-sugar epimerase
MGKSILITGITGFLGSHLGRYFSEKRYQVIGLKRSNSNTSRCEDFVNSVLWIDVDKVNWENEIIKSNPQIILHAAWEGVTSASRDNYQNQLKNLDLITRLLEISKILKVEKFISLGTQAEYGKLESIANEEQPLAPNSAYAIVKVMASKLVEHFCSSNDIAWYWLRVFSIFGESESENWLIPNLVKNIVSNQSEIYLSSCEQKYAYMYIGDFVRMVQPFVEKKPISGVYNISGTNAVKLRDIVITIHDYLKSNNTILNFGAIPQRENQSFIVEGSMNKYVHNVQDFEYCSFKSSLFKTVEHYKLKFEIKIH